MLKIWGRKTSSNVQALMWCVGELGLAFHRYDIGHKYGGTDTGEFHALNPNRTVPVLQDGSNPPLWETGCILRYLADQYSQNGFWPADIIQRSRVDKWAEWAKINIAQNFTTPVFWRVVRTVPSDRDPAAIKNAVSGLEEKLSIAETRLSDNTFLAGPNFSLADIQFGHILFRYYDIGIDRADLPALARYYTQLTQRPAFQKHVMISYDDLKVN